jgi:hypothetical protein
MAGDGVRRRQVSCVSVPHSGASRSGSAELHRTSASPFLPACRPASEPQALVVSKANEAANVGGLTRSYGPPCSQAACLAYGHGPLAPVLLARALALAHILNLMFSHCRYGLCSMPALLAAAGRS